MSSSPLGLFGVLVLVVLIFFFLASISWHDIRQLMRVYVPQGEKTGFILQVPELGANLEALHSPIEMSNVEMTAQQGVARWLFG